MRFLAVLCFFCLGFSASAQREPVRLQVGFDGQIVTNRWNPLSLTLRDMPDATLEITILQGSIREGEIPIRYVLPVEGRTGVQAVADDVFIPDWRGFSWALRTDARVLASGSLDRRDSGAEPHAPLNLIVSARPGTWLGSYPEDARTAAVAPGDLPTRLAAYDGVASIFIDGSAPAPKAEALLAAASAGANVVLLEPLTSSHASLRQLAPEGGTRLGAGWLLLEDAAGLRRALARESVDEDALLEALITEDLRTQAPYQEATPLILAAGLYTVISLLLLRLGGPAGLLTSLSVAAVTSFLAWSWLRPETERAELGRSLDVSAGGLSRRLEVRSLFSLPGGAVSLGERAVPAERTAYTQTYRGLELDAPRWTGLELRLKPSLRTSALRWQDGVLINTGDGALFDVYVFGLGPQPPLEPGASLVPSENEQVKLPEVYNRLLAHLPRGSALARSAGRLHAALPETPIQASLGVPPVLP